MFLPLFRLNSDLNSWIRRHELLNLVELRDGMDPFLIHNGPHFAELQKNRTATKRITPRSVGMRRKAGRKTPLSMIVDFKSNQVRLVNV